MTTLAHAWHQFRFDLQRMRWWLAGYVALIVLPLLLLDTSTGNFTSSVAFFTLATAMLAAATVVQVDGPLDGQAFWQGKPIAGSGVALAKLLFALGVMMLIPLGVLALALSAKGVPADDRVAILVGASMDTLRWLSVAIAIAVVSRDRKLAPLLFIAAVFTSMLLTRSRWGFDPLQLGYGFLQTLTVGSAVALLVLAYAHRLASKTAAVAGMFVATLGASTIGPPRSVAPAAAPIPDRLVTNGTESLRIVGPVPATVNHAVGARLEIVNPQPGIRYTLQAARITLHFADRGPLTLGAHATGPIESRLRSAMVPPGMQLAPSVTPPGVQQPVGLDLDIAPGVGLTLDNIDWYDRLPKNAVTRVEIAGELHRYRAGLTKTVQWQTGHAYTEAGRTVQIMPPDTSNLEALAIEFSTLAPARARDPRMGVSAADPIVLTSFTLLERGLGRATPLFRAGTGTASASFILPSVERSTRVAHVLAPVPPAPRGDQTAARELMIVEWDRESYTPVHVQAVTTPAPAQRGTRPSVADSLR